MTAPVRVRIAPSPTGNLHVGTARTALFNAMFAKNQGGAFILRIEDTDKERSQEIYTQNIYDSLRALGLSWDEGPDVGGDYGPYSQSQRTELYQEWVQKLLDTDQAYPCYITEAELTEQREAAQAAGKPWSYQRPQYTEEQLATFQTDPSRKPVIRFAIPKDPPTLVVHDVVRGDVSFETALIDDFVILKSDGTPTYNFAVVVDDLLMEITHVIRGEDHLSNTPKQIMLYQALNAPVPTFAHVGMILAPDRSKLSKRHGATAVSDYITQGYLPEAFCNFLALLGWSPSDGEEVASLDQMVSQFSLERITQSPAVFDLEKLNWLNGQYIRQLDISDLWERSRPFLKDFPLEEYPTKTLMMMVDAVRKNLTTLEELPQHVAYFFGQDVTRPQEIIEAVLSTPEAQQVLTTFQSQWLPTAPLTDLPALEGALKEFVQSQKPLKAKAVMWPLRAAFTGQTHGADLAKTLYILGQAKIHHRLHTVPSLHPSS